MKTMVTKQTALKMALILASLALLSACGAKKVGTGSSSTDLASRSTTLDSDTSSSTSGDKTIAGCNGKTMNFLTAQLMAYKDGQGNIRPEVVRLYISKMSTLFNDADYTVRLYRWKANKNNVTYFDSTPLQMRLENKTSFASVTGYLDSLNANSLSTSGVSASTSAKIFETHIMVVDLKDVAGDYDALKIAVYKGSSKIEEMDMLIPLFYAHPSTYANSHGSVLAGIHPFYGQGSAGWTTAHFAGTLNEYCF